MARKGASQIVDEFIAAVATVGSSSFDLNSHSGLTADQQTAFYLFGRNATFTVQQLTDKYGGLLALAGRSDGKKQIASAQKECEAAVSMCQALRSAGAVPPLELILAANSGCARAVDVADDVLIAAG